MTERYDDSDSSWEFVGKDSSDSEDEDLKPRRVHHDTGLPEEFVETIELHSIAKVDTDSDIEVCSQIDDFNEQNSSTVLDDQVAAVSSDNGNTVHMFAAPGMDVMKSDESDVERIEEEVSSEVTLENLEDKTPDDDDDDVIVKETEDTASEPQTSSSDNLTDSTLSVKYRVFDMVCDEDTNEEVDERFSTDQSSSENEEQSDIDEWLSIEDKSSQTLSYKTSNVSVGTIAMETTSTVTPTGSDINSLHDTNVWFLGAICLATLAMGFSLGTTYTTVMLVDYHAVVPSSTPQQSFYSKTEMKGTPSYLLLSVDMLKEKITHLREENERLKHRTKLVETKHNLSLQLKKGYKTTAMQQKVTINEIKRKLKHLKKRNRRKMRRHKLILAEAIHSALHYRHLYDLNKHHRSTPLENLAIEILYKEMQNKSNKIVHLQHELGQSENMQNTAEFIANQEKLRASLAEQKLRTSKLRRILVQMIAKYQQDANDDDVLEVNNQDNNVTRVEEDAGYADYQQTCVIESLLTNSKSKSVPELFLNLSMPLFNDYANAVSFSKLQTDPPTLHTLFLSSLKTNASDQKDSHIISYVPSVYFNHQFNMQGMCRRNLSKLRRNAYILFLKNKYASDDIFRQSQEIMNIKSQLNYAKLTIAEFQQNQTEANNRTASDTVCNCQPTMNQCLTSVINTTSLQSFMNFTNIKTTVNSFAHEMNQSAHDAWEGIVKTLQKQQKKFQKSKTVKESKPRKHKEKKHEKKMPDRDEEEVRSPTHRRDHDKEKKHEGNWWKKKKDKSNKFFGKIHENVKKAVKRGGKKVEQAFKKAKNTGHEIKEKAHKFYQKHKNKPRKVFETVKLVGEKVVEKVVNVTQTIVSSKKHPIYCYGPTSDHTGCSEDIDQVNEEMVYNSHEPDDNTVTDLWYIKRSEQREKMRDGKDECEDDDWYFKRQEIREVLRMQEEEKRQYENMIRKHIEAVDKDGHGDGEDVFVDDYVGMDKKTKDAVDDMVYFNFQHQKDDRVLFPNL